VPGPPWPTEWMARVGVLCKMARFWPAVGAWLGKGACHLTKYLKTSIEKKSLIIVKSATSLRAFV
jgi:hypothetical protein